MAQVTGVMDVDEASFQDAVISRSYQIPVMVDFWADWCAPCKALAPVLDGVVESLAGQVALAKVDTDAQQALATPKPLPPTPPPLPPPPAAIER